MGKGLLRSSMVATAALLTACGGGSGGSSGESAAPAPAPTPSPPATDPGPTPPPSTASVLTGTLLFEACYDSSLQTFTRTLVYHRNDNVVAEFSAFAPVWLPDGGC